jgi:hypothetical protein
MDAWWCSTNDGLLAQARPRGLTNGLKQDKIEPATLWGYPRSGEPMATGEISNRLKRIEGQIRGLQRMVEEQRDCEAILTQLMAGRAALDRVGLLVADN